MVTEWCKPRDYSREREQLSCKCSALEVGEDDPLTLALTQALLEEENQRQIQRENEKEKEKEKEKSPEEEVEVETSGRERRGTTFTALEEDDFDPLATTGADDRADDSATRNSSEREKRTASSTRGLGDPMKMGLEEDEGEAEAFHKKFYEGSKYTPGLERKETWQDWRERRSHLLSVRSFVDKAHADDESLSVVAANISFQVVGAAASMASSSVSGAAAAAASVSVSAPQAATTTTTGNASSTAASRLQVCLSISFPSMPLRDVFLFYFSQPLVHNILPWLVTDHHILLISVFFFFRSIDLYVKGFGGCDCAEEAGARRE